MRVKIRGDFFTIQSLEREKARKSCKTADQVESEANSAGGAMGFIGRRLGKRRTILGDANARIVLTMPVL